LNTHKNTDPGSWLLDPGTWILDSELQAQKIDMTYKSLEIWTLARDLVIEIHMYESLHSRIETLGKKLNRFIQAIEKEHISKK
jgi:hypothetical protein